MLPLRPHRWGDARAGALADRTRVVGVCPGGQDRGEAGYVSQGRCVVLSSNAGRLHMHAPQQRPVARHHANWAKLLRSPLLLALLGPPVLEPNLQRRQEVSSFYRNTPAVQQTRDILKEL